MKNKYIVITKKKWHEDAFISAGLGKKSNWILMMNEEECVFHKINDLNPRYIFFPHWSWIVPDEIINNFECVCFHSSDVPYGRGGSPIQNLIIRGHKETKISALKMVKELDAGPVYCKRPLSLEGSAQDIYESSALIIADMMQWIAANESTPLEQEGVPVVFKRRGGDDNILPLEGQLEELYNHIRMLDAETYPSSFINHGEFKLEFSEASLENDSLEAKVKITKRRENEG
jgi:methionyl-tRNA formyltransferase